MRHALLLATVLLIVNAAPWESALEFDRDAVASGELWRLLTGNAVHYSGAHVAFDLSVLAIAAAMLGRRSWGIAAAASLAVGLGLFVFAPHVETYRGLSGVSVAMVTAAVLQQLVRTRHPLIAGIGLLLAVKLVAEVATGRFIGPALELGDMGAPIPLAHLLGAVAGAAAIFLPARRSRAQERTSMSTARV